MDDPLRAPENWEPKGLPVVYFNILSFYISQY